MSDTQRAFSSTADELSHELDQLLESFCSNEHQAFCLQQHIATHQQLQRVRQTIQQVRTLIPTVGLTHNANSESLRQSLMRTCLEMLEHYNVTCQHRHIRSHSHDTIDQLNAEWQEISQAFDPKAKEQRNFRQLLDNLKSLRKAWKRPQQVSRIMTSMLATYELKAGAYVVSVDRYNHSQLGLKTKAAGSRQIVFECNRLTREEQMEVVAGICNRFASIFAQNAQYNLAQIDNQIRKGQMTVLARKLRLLQEQVYLDVEGASGMSSNQDPGVVYQGHRFSTAVTSSLWCPDDAMGVQTMPLPSFVPSPWEWPDLLKSRRPFHPMFFGLVARKRKSRSSFASRFKGWFSTDSPQPSVNTEMEDELFATLSVDRLCRHLVRAGRQFYEDVATNARLKYSQDAHTLQEIGRDIVDVYCAIKIDSARTAMQRILSILHDLALIDCQSVGDDTSSRQEVAASTSSQPRVDTSLQYSLSVVSN